MQWSKVRWHYLMEQSENFWSNIFEISNTLKLLIPIILATAVANNAAGIYQILTPNNQQLVLGVKAIVQRHFSSTYSIILSFTRNGLENENTRSVSPYWEHAVTTDALLDSIHSESRWTLHISRPTSNLQTFRAQEHNWNCIMKIWIHRATEMTMKWLSSNYRRYKTPDYCVTNPSDL